MVLGAALVAAAVLFVVLQDDGGDDGGEATPTVAEDTTATPTTATQASQPAEPPVEVIQVRNGAPVGGVRELTYTNGEQIRIEVKLDEPQEDLHIHGYDIERLNPTGSASFDFKATIEGIFELEAHGPSGDIVLAEIAVEPS